MIVSYNYSVTVFVILLLQCYCGYVVCLNEQHGEALGFKVKQEFPALKVTMQDTLFHEFSAKLTPYLEQVVLATPIPDQTGQEKVLGFKVDWWLSNIKLTAISFAQNTLTTLPSTGLKLLVTNGSGKLTADWKWKRAKGLIKPSDKGSAVVSLSKVTLDLELEISSDSNGQLTVQAKNVYIKFGKLSVSVSSTLTGWLYDLFFWLFNSVVKGSVTSSVQSTLSKFIVDVNQSLQQLPMIIPVAGTPLLFDTRLPHAPLFTSEYLTIPFNGGFYANESFVSPYSPSPRDHFCSMEMLNIIIDQFFFDTFFYAVASSTALSTRITSSNILPALEPLLNTDSYKELIPALYKSFPNSSMEIGLDIPSAPDMNITTDGVEADVTVLVKFFVLSNSTTEPVLILRAPANLEFILFMTEQIESIQDGLTSIHNVLHLKLHKLAFKFFVEESRIGKVNLFIINSALWTAINAQIIPVFNKHFADKGVQLPAINGLKLINPNFVYYPHFVCLETSVDLTLIKQSNVFDIDALMLASAQHLQNKIHLS